MSRFSDHLINAAYTVATPGNSEQGGDVHTRAVRAFERAAFERIVLPDTGSAVFFIRGPRINIVEQEIDAAAGSAEHYVNMFPRFFADDPIGWAKIVMQVMVIRGLQEVCASQLLPGFEDGFGQDELMSLHQPRPVGWGPELVDILKNPKPAPEVGWDTIFREFLPDMPKKRPFAKSFGNGSCGLRKWVDAYMSLHELAALNYKGQERSIYFLALRVIFNAFKYVPVPSGRKVIGVTKKKPFYSLLYVQREEQWRANTAEAIRLGLATPPASSDVTMEDLHRAALVRAIPGTPVTSREMRTAYIDHLQEQSREDIRLREAQLEKTRLLIKHREAVARDEAARRPPVADVAFEFNSQGEAIPQLPTLTIKRTESAAKARAERVIAIKAAAAQTARQRKQMSLPNKV